MVLRPSVCQWCVYLTSYGLCEKYGIHRSGKELEMPGDCPYYVERTSLSDEDMRLLRGFAEEAAAEESIEEEIAGGER